MNRNRKISEARRKTKTKPKHPYQQLEPKMLLAGIIESETNGVISPEFELATQTQFASPESAEATLSVTAEFSANRFRLPVQAPTTEQLGVIDEPISVSGSNNFFDRVDRYEFEVSEDGSLDLDLEFDRRTYGRLLVFDQSRNLIEASSLIRSKETSLTAELDSGSYVAIVFGGWGDYELDFDFEGNTPPPEELPPEEPVEDESPTDVNPPSNEDPQPTEPVTSPTILPEVAWYGSNLDWNLNSVNSPEAWEAGYHGEGVVVAVIDTGVNINHSDLDDNIWVNTDEIAGDGIDNDGNGYVDDRYGWNFVGNNSDVSDDNGHGTHVAGSIGAERNGFGATGVAPESEIMSIKVLAQNGSGFVSSIANGIRYAVDNGADIINLSLGGGFSSTIASAISYAASKDVFVVAAAGNDGASVPGNPASLSRTYDNLLSVGAYDSNNRIASFSNGVGNSGAVQVDAPGVSVYSTAANGGYTFLSGTSMATPHVAGLAALTLSANPNLTAASLRNIIVQSSDQTAGGSDSRGAVNARLAIPLAINGGAEVASSSSSLATTSGSRSRVRSIPFSSLTNTANSFEIESGLVEPGERDEFTGLQTAPQSGEALKLFGAHENLSKTDGVQTALDAFLDSGETDTNAKGTDLAFETFEAELA